MERGEKETRESWAPKYSRTSLGKRWHRDSLAVVIAFASGKTDLTRLARRENHCFHRFDAWPYLLFDCFLDSSVLIIDWPIIYKYARQVSLDLDVCGTASCANPSESITWFGSTGKKKEKKFFFLLLKAPRPVVYYYRSTATITKSAALLNKLLSRRLLFPLSLFLFFHSNMEINQRPLRNDYK